MAYNPLLTLMMDPMVLIYTPLIAMATITYFRRQEKLQEMSSLARVIASLALGVTSALIINILLAPFLPSLI